MDRRCSRSPDSPGRRHRTHRRDYSSRRRSRSWSRSRSRDRSRDRRHSRSHSRSSDRNYRRGPSPDLYKDLIDQDYQNDRDRYHRVDNRRSRDRNDRDKRDNKDRNYRRAPSTESYLEEINSNDSFDSDQIKNEHYQNQTPSSKIIILGLSKNVQEADIRNDLIHYGLRALSISLIRKRKTGPSRGFAFVEFRSEEEATRWMAYKQGILVLQDQCRAIMQYSVGKEPPTDWYCAKCGVFNFKRRENCFKCYASRKESEIGGEGSDEVSNILTKKIMLRNLDALTNEEGVLTVMQEVVPTLVTKISKILICRDPLTSTSRGICYLSFDNLVDSMNTHNALKAIEPPLQFDNREVLVSYCVDSENRQISKSTTKSLHSENTSSASSSNYSANNTHQYSLADVPRLAEYSATMYASTPAEHDHYFKYYTDFYVQQITKGQYSNLPTMSQIGETANSGAAVAFSAIERKQKQKSAGSAAVASVQIPTGLDNKKYPTPDQSQYQYDTTSSYYYDASTGLYYDAHSQYYYNNETGAYLYWNKEKSTYTIAPTSDKQTFSDADYVTAKDTQSYKDESAGNATTAVTSSSAYDEDTNNASEEKKESNKKEPKHDRVKVAKKIVKDMEKWAKQLNQKKDMDMCQVPAPKREEEPMKISRGGYADVGFSILENKERTKMSIDLQNSSMPAQINKLISTYGSDSDNDQNDHAETTAIQQSLTSEKDYVDFAKLTCLLCKRAFQSLEILNKHLKMSNLHKENLKKYNLNRGQADDIASNTSNLSYRDRAKERRQKYGECDPPPVNRSRERFEKEIEKHSAAIQVQSNSNLASVPIGENNVGNRLLQKMGWSEGQGLGRKNQGRTEIIEAESRAPAAGLGTKSTNFAPGDDYKSYIKRMMKSRYDQQ